jgi:NTF2 fold immunity protein
MKKIKIFIISSLFLLIVLIVYVSVEEKGSGTLMFIEPRNGFVPDEATAVKIAEIIGIKVFGNNLKDYKPFHADLKNDSIWHIYGLPKKQLFSVRFGGGPVWEIKKKDGKILKVYISR